jgi:hypothetical protein
MMVSMTVTDWQAVLVDLLNTTPVVDGTGTDTLADAPTARSWLRAHGGGRADDVDVVRRLRDDLQRVVRGESTPDVLRPYLGDVRQRPEVGADGLTWSLTGADWSAHVVLAWGAVESEAPGRLRPCRDRALVLDEQLRKSNEGAAALPPRRRWLAAESERSTRESNRRAGVGRTARMST